MKSKPAPHRPKFQVGDMARLNRFLPPVLSGTLVTVDAVGGTRFYPRYQVSTAEYQAQPVWADESDLDWVLA